MRPFDDVDLHAYADNQVGANRREAIATFLKQMPEEADRVARWQGQSQAIQAAFAAVTTEPVPLWLTVAHIADRDRSGTSSATKPKEQETRVGEVVARKRQSRTSPPPLLGIALAFVIGVSVPYAAARWPGFEGNQMFAGSRSPRQSFERRAIEAHNTFGTDVDRPIDVADTPPGALKAWLQRRVPFSVPIPDLRAQGWALRGGRLAPGDQGPGALLVFDNTIGDRLSLFLGRVAEPASGEAVAANNVVSWIDGSVGYALVTSRSPDWLDRNAGQLSSAVRGDQKPE